MDEPRLDRIARAMASGVSRRRLARGLVAGLAGAGLAVHHRQEAAAIAVCLVLTTLEQCLACCTVNHPEQGKERGQCVGGCHRDFAPGGSGV
jgi:hypothetical protein